MERAQSRKFWKDSFELVINDILQWCVTYSKGRLVAHTCSFADLTFDPFEFFRTNSETRKGFFYKNYSTGGSDRMYFSAENAARIDFIRGKIEEWRSENFINENEYSFLLASLIESVSAVSNTAGVYGAFLKHWDPRARRPLAFDPVRSRFAPHGLIHAQNFKVEDIIANVECDVLYLDPPYTQNQYGTQYHLLETLVKNDAPSLSPITGSRPTAPMRSDWSKDVRKHILFDRVVATTKAKYILCSYSPDGFMSKSYIEAVLKRYGEAETFECRRLPFRKYTNFKSREKGDHFEYLFFIKKKPARDVLYTSPLNYIGSKTRMIPFLKDHFPSNVVKFIDAFGGEFNVGINSDAETIIYNDYNHLVAGLIESFRKNDTLKYVQFVRRQISKFGLEKEKSETYLKARAYYNSLPDDRRDPRLLYAVIMYGFNQQIRFNGDHEFNNPVGQRWFNEKVLEKLISFSRVVRDKNVLFKSVDYHDLLDDAEPGSFVYMDPPYRLTTGAYNDGKRGIQWLGSRHRAAALRFRREAARSLGKVHAVVCPRTQGQGEHRAERVACRARVSHYRT